MVKKWESLTSGKPVNCVPFQYLFSGDGVIETSNGTTRGDQHVFQILIDLRNPKNLQLVRESTPTISTS